MNLLTSIHVAVLVFFEIVEVADIARTRLNVVLFDIGKENTTFPIVAGGLGTLSALGAASQLRPRPPFPFLLGVFYSNCCSCVFEIVQIADIARTRFNVVLFDIGKKSTIFPIVARDLSTLSAAGRSFSTAPSASYFQGPTAWLLNCALGKFGLRLS